MRVNTASKFLCLLLITVIIISGCASSTILQTTPNDASVYIKGEKLGYTPYKYSDRKIAGASTLITFKKEGYEDYITTLRRVERFNAIALAGILFIYPLFWVVGYDIDHHYYLDKAEVSGKRDPVIYYPVKEEANLQLNPAEKSSNLLSGENDHIILKVDSIVRTNSLPQNLTVALEESRDIGSPAISFYQDYIMVLVYFTVTEKTNINIGNSQAMAPVTIVDNAGKSRRAILERGPSYIKIAGKGTQLWNPATQHSDGILIKEHYLLFQMPENTQPVSMTYKYKYRVGTQSRKVYTGELWINLAN